MKFVSKWISYELSRFLLKQNLIKHFINSSVRRKVCDFTSTTQIGGKVKSINDNQCQYKLYSSLRVMMISVDIVFRLVAFETEIMTLKW